MPSPRRFEKTVELQLEPPDGAPPGWWKKNVIGTGTEGDYVVQRLPLSPYPVTTVEYVPSHFNVCTADAGMVHELILQSAGLPEIFPARRIGEYSYVDGGIVDNVPLAALADVPDQAAILVVPLDSRLDEDAVRKELAANLERLGRSAPQSLPDLVLLTPSRPLGNFLTGTLDFGAVRARALMQLGYCDTIRRLARRSTTLGDAVELGRFASLGPPLMPGATRDAS
jgi:predicted acylesterase/phospholipase RssA